MTSCRGSYGCLLGQTHCTLSGVSPHPSAVLPARSATFTFARATVTDETVSGPNFSGIRVCTGMKYNSAPISRTSVGLLIGGKTIEGAAGCTTAHPQLAHHCRHIDRFAPPEP